MPMTASVLADLIKSKVDAKKEKFKYTTAVDSSGGETKSEVQALQESGGKTVEEKLYLGIAEAVVEFIKANAVVSVNVIMPPGSITTMGSPSTQSNTSPASGTGTGTIS